MKRVLGKITNFRSKEPDVRATRNLELVHDDFAGLMNVVGKGRFEYAISLADEHSGAFMIYLLKQKSDVVVATEKFLVDSAPFGLV